MSEPSNSLQGPVLAHHCANKQDTPNEVQKGLKNAAWGGRRVLGYCHSC